MKTTGNKWTAAEGLAPDGSSDWDGVIGALKYKKVCFSDLIAI